MTLQLEIPSTMGFNSKVFDLGYRQQMTGQTGGFLQTIDRTTPMWYAEYHTVPLRDTRYNDTIQFLYQLEGAMETFLGYDPRRPMPWAYRTQPWGTDPWKQAAGVSPRIETFDYANSYIVLNQMANGALVTAGDYVSVKMGNIWYLFRAYGGAIAGPAGGFSNNKVVIYVKPRPQILGFVANTPVRYERACAEMKIVGGLKEEDSVDSFPSFSFKAFQFINRG